MSFSFGRETLAIPGPSIIPDRVLNAMHRASPNIYEGELVDLTHALIPDLKAVARTNGNVAIYIANGHGAWEASIRNLFVAGDRILVLQTGRFATGWGQMAEAAGVDVQWMDFGMESDVDCDQLEAVLRADSEGRIRAVLAVHTDTSTSVRNDVEGMRKALDASGHDALLMIDCVASLACDQYEMDDWGVDVTIAACQKGLMTPAGLGFVYFNEKADRAGRRASPGVYWDWEPRSRPELFYQYFGGTAPTHHMYGLREALTILVREEGIENAWRRHEVIANAYWAAVDAWGTGGAIRHNIEDRNKRSRAVSTIETGPGEAAIIREWSEKKGGVTLGIGLGFGTPGSADFSRRFRIGHMGHNNMSMAMGVMGTIDAALKSLRIAHGDGALDVASRVFAEAVGADEARVASAGHGKLAASG